MEEIKTYEEYVKKISKMLEDKFTDKEGATDFDSIAHFLIVDYYLNNPVKAMKDLDHKLNGMV